MLGETLQGRRRRLSTVAFRDGLAIGWAFGVPDAYKASLDILATERLLSPRSPLRRDLAQLGVECSAAAMNGDREALEALRVRMQMVGLTVTDLEIGRDATGARRGVFTVETQGPGTWAEFAPGDIFYSPVEVRRMTWRDALPILSHVVQVTDFFAGRATLQIAEYFEGKRGRLRELECRTDELVHLLYTGEIPREAVAPTSVDAELDAAVSD